MKNKLIEKFGHDTLSLIMITIAILPSIILGMVIAVEYSLVLGTILIISSQYFALNGLDCCIGKYKDELEKMEKLLIYHVKDINEKESISVYLIGYNKYCDRDKGYFIDILKSYNVKIYYKDTQLIDECSLIYAFSCSSNDDIYELLIAKNKEKRIIYIS